MTRVESCGCRYNDIPNTNYFNDILVECEYLCDNHKNKFILESFNLKLRSSQTL